MIIRETTDTDIPGILKVLKSSLGEVSSKKTEEVWRFKHIDNPFGHSLVLLAEENNEIIGVRAFMRWQWQRGDEILSAFRAVDTATHPDHQGKGIFKKLTLKALELGKNQHDHFVFNTPNSQSKPGYLKMGWKEVSKINVRLIPVNPLLWRRKPGNQLNFDNFNSALTQGILLDHNKKLSKGENFFTPKTTQFLNWRYIKNPLQEYQVFGSDRIFTAAYLKEHKQNIRELRVVEMIYLNDTDIAELKGIIKNWAKEFRAHYISYHSPDGIKISSIEVRGAFGPMLTVKDLNTNDQNLFDLNSWAYSLGDLELF